MLYIYSYLCEIWADFYSCKNCSDIDVLKVIEFFKRIKYYNNTLLGKFLKMLDYHPSDDFRAWYLQIIKIKCLILKYFIII